LLQGAGEELLRLQVVECGVRRVVQLREFLVLEAQAVVTIAVVQLLAAAVDKLADLTAL
jgi:hypothetical protein